MVSAKNSARVRTGAGRTTRRLIYQELMDDAVSRRDELNVFIRVLLKLLEQSEEQKSHASQHSK